MSIDIDPGKIEVLRALVHLKVSRAQFFALDGGSISAVRVNLFEALAHLDDLDALIYPNRRAVNR